MRGITLFITIKILLLFVIVHTLALLVPAGIFRFIIIPLLQGQIGFFILGSLIFFINLVLVLIFLILFTGLAWRILNLRYSGEHELDLRNVDVKKWLMSIIIYLPTDAILDLLHFYPLKTIHARLFGAKLGKGIILGGMILDPCLLEIGNYTVVGGFSTIFGHATERGKIIFAEVRIGTDCGVGAKSTIMAGAEMQDSSMLGAHSLLPKNAIIPFGKTYGGVPAKEIREKNRGVNHD